MSENWKNKKVRWQAILWFAGGLVLCTALLYWGLLRDEQILLDRKESLHDVQQKLRQEKSEKQTEINMADSADYIEQRARENGYLMPGEIRFVVTNLDELLANGGDAQTEIAEEGQ